MQYVKESLSESSLDLRYTSEEEKKVIAEAIKIIDSIDELYDNELDGESERRDSLFKSIRNAKFLMSEWNRHAGAYKVAHIKDNIVVKNIPIGQFKEEVRLWKETRNRPELKKYRKNLARIFGTYKGFMFQRLAPGEINNCVWGGKCEKIAKVLFITDWYQNHGHDLSGDPVYFDSRI